MKVELYHRQDCPYSAKVREYIMAHSLKDSVQFYDVDEDERRHDVLEDLTGDDQVPCLVVNNEPMLESNEIVEWLDAHEDELFAGEDELED